MMGGGAPEMTDGAAAGAGRQRRCHMWHRSRRARLRHRRVRWGSAPPHHVGVEGDERELGVEAQGAQAHLTVGHVADVVGLERVKGVLVDAADVSRELRKRAEKVEDLGVGVLLDEDRVLHVLVGADVHTCHVPLAQRRARSCNPTADDSQPGRLWNGGPVTLEIRERPVKAAGLVHRAEPAH